MLYKTNKKPNETFWNIHPSIQYTKNVLSELSYTHKRKSESAFDQHMHKNIHNTMSVYCTYVNFTQTNFESKVQQRNLKMI